MKTNALNMELAPITEIPCMLCQAFFKDNGQFPPYYFYGLKGRTIVANLYRIVIIMICPPLRVN
jgi:hypothetical protein